MKLWTSMAVPWGGRLEGFGTRWMVKQASVCTGTLVRRHALLPTVEGAIGAPAALLLLFSSVALLRRYSGGNGRVLLSNLRLKRLARAKTRKIRERRGETDDESH